MNWPALPFVRFLLPLGGGIFLGTLDCSFSVSTIILSISVLSILFLSIFARRQINYRWRKLFGICLFCLFLGLGFLLSYLQTPWHHPRHIRHFADGFPHIYFQVEHIKKQETGLSLEGNVMAVGNPAGTIHPVHGRLLVYLAPDSLSPALLPGDHLLVNASVQPLEAAKNPQAFDFAGYLSRKGIYHRTFVKAGNWKKIGRQNVYPQRQLEQLRQAGLQVLSAHLPGDNELSIGAALIMGHRLLLSEDIREAYTNTGAVHVLAVSGLHVGIVFLGLTWLLDKLGWKGRKRRWTRSLVLLSAIWSFAMFTGGSASVLRAAAMFSFVILGEALYRRHNIYNTLAASAFLLLCIQPGLLVDIGFQLSYLAVIGIVFFQGRIYRSWYIGNKLGDYLWKLTSVSIAAQLTTLPISLFYFHQFPFYFWLSGWVVVPAAMVILILGLALLFCNKLGILATAIGTLLYGVIWLMNYLIIYIEQLPAGLLTGIWMSTGIVVILYLTILFLMSGLSKKRLWPIQWALAGLIIVGAWHSWVRRQAMQQQTLTIYYLRGHSAIDFFDGRQGFCLSDLPREDRALQFATGNFRTYRHIRQITQQTFQDTSFQAAHFFRKGNFLHLGSHTLVVLDQLPAQVPPQPLAVDILLIRNNPKLTIPELEAYFIPKMMVFDASNSKGRITKWKAACAEKNQAHYDIAQQGALVMHLGQSAVNSR